MKSIYFRLLPWIKKDPSVLESQKHLQSVLKEQYKELGSPSWEEYTIIILFIVMVLLWITRDFSPTPGWAIIFPKE
jgi:sodium-dependent dicarboxylate transporter 2/3/5